MHLHGNVKELDGLYEWSLCACCSYILAHHFAWNPDWIPILAQQVFFRWLTRVSPRNVARSSTAIQNSDLFKNKFWSALHSTTYFRLPSSNYWTVVVVMSWSIRPSNKPLLKQIYSSMEIKEMHCWVFVPFKMGCVYPIAWTWPTSLRRSVVARTSWQLLWSLH